MDKIDNARTQSDRWDKKSRWYADTAEVSTMQGTVTCAVMTEMRAADRVLEVACGPGRHSLMLATIFLKKGGVLVSCDYSGVMVQSLADNYEKEDNDYKLVPGNKFLIDTIADFTEFADSRNTSLKTKCDLEKIIK